MKRKEQITRTIDQSNDASCMGNRRYMGKRAKRNSSKRLRQLFDKEDKMPVCLECGDKGSKENPLMLVVERHMCKQCVTDLQPEDANRHRVGVGDINCIYCDSKDCDFSCDESQVGGFGD